MITYITPVNIRLCLSQIYISFPTTKKFWYHVGFNTNKIIHYPLVLTPDITTRKLKVWMKYKKLFGYTYSLMGIPIVYSTKQIGLDSYFVSEYFAKLIPNLQEN